MIILGACGQHVQVPVGAPWFCHNLDCPEYTVVEATDDYEVRDYKAGGWESFAAAAVARGPLGECCDADPPLQALDYLLELFQSFFLRCPEKEFEARIDCPALSYLSQHRAWVAIHSTASFLLRPAAAPSCPNELLRRPPAAGAGAWVSTDVEAYAYALAINKAFQQLYQYIDGANVDAVKVPMTAPVLTKIRQGRTASRLSCQMQHVVPRCRIPSPD